MSRCSSRLSASISLSRSAHQHCLANGMDCFDMRSADSCNMAVAAKVRPDKPARHISPAAAVACLQIDTGQEQRVPSNHGPAPLQFQAVRRSMRAARRSTTGPGKLPRTPRPISRWLALTCSTSFPSSCQTCCFECACARVVLLDIASDIQEACEHFRLVLHDRATLMAA